MTDKLTDTIKSGFDFSNAMQLASTFPPSVKGTLLNSTNGLPLPNMSVVMHSARTALTKESDVRQPEGLIVGEAVTDKAGSFDISFSQTREAQEELLLLTQFPGSAFVLSVAQPGKKDPLTVSKPYPIRSGGNTVALCIELAGEEIPASMWDTVGSRLEEARITQIHEIASLLTSTSPSQQLFADSSQGQREALLVELEEAFLDPSGLLRKSAPVPSFHESKAPGTMEQYQITLKNYFYEPGVEQAFNELLSKMHRYNDLSDVPWILDLNVLRKGGPLAALKIFQDLASNLDTYPTLETEEE